MGNLFKLLALVGMIPKVIGTLEDGKEVLSALAANDYGAAAAHLVANPDVDAYLTKMDAVPLDAPVTTKGGALRALAPDVMAMLDAGIKEEAILPLFSKLGI